MLCDRAVTLAFDAVPDGGTMMRDGARALCAENFQQAIEEQNG